jgi:signal transduction histidine kinase
MAAPPPATWTMLAAQAGPAPVSRPQPATGALHNPLDPGVAYMAHELTQPLTAILFNAEAALEWLLKNPSDLSAATRALERIIGNVLRARRVVTSIRDLTRAEAVEMVDLDLGQVVEQLLQLVGTELSRHGITVEVEIAADLPAVRGDRCQLERVVSNLLSNAIEAMCSTRDWQRNLQIRVQPEGGGQVQVSVEDSGPGIDPAHLGRIFDPLFTTKADGVGLGLSICRSIAEAHGGRLSASPNAPCGSIFRFSVPASEGESTR